MPGATKATFVSRLPTHEEVAERAYDIFVARGSLHGFDQEHWFEAERLLGTADGAAAMGLAGDHRSTIPKRIRRPLVAATPRGRRRTKPTTTELGD